VGGSFNRNEGKQLEEKPMEDLLTRFIKKAAVEAFVSVPFQICSNDSKEGHKH